METRKALMMVAGGVVMSIALAAPVVVNTSLHHISDELLAIDRKYCIEEWDNRSLRVAYTVAMFTVQFCVPIFLTALLYLLLCVRMSRLEQRNRSEQFNRTNRMLCAIVVTYIVCWLPWNVFSLLAELHRDRVDGAHFTLVDLLLKLFAMLSACANPLLYVWLNRGVRADIRAHGCHVRIMSHFDPEYNTHTHSHVPARDAQQQQLQQQHRRHVQQLDMSNAQVLAGERNRLLVPGSPYSALNTSHVSISNCHSTAHTCL